MNILMTHILLIIVNNNNNLNCYILDVLVDTSRDNPIKQTDVICHFIHQSNNIKIMLNDILMLK